MSTIELKDGGLVEKLGKRSQKKIRGGIDALLAHEGQRALARMSLRVTAGGKSGLRARTGLLRASLGFVTERNGNVSSLDLGTIRLGGKAAQVLDYAAIQEFGGTITKSPGWLTIPLEAALSPSGIARFSARDTMMKGRVPRLTGTFFEGDQKRLILFGVFGPTSTAPLRKARKTSLMREARGEALVKKAEAKKATPSALRRQGTKSILDKTAIPLFVLVHKVTIPPRPYVGPERKIAFKNIRDKLPETMVQGIKEK